MNPEVVITCAVTGAGDTVGKHPDIPVTPKQIAASALDAARAGAAIVHCHVRDPATGKGSRDVALYREVVARIRDAETDVVINLTAGMGGDLVIGPDDAPTAFREDTDLVGAIDRLPHVAELLPEICSLDCGSYNFGEGSLVYVSTPDMLRRGALRIRELGVKPELEIFDTGHLSFTLQMLGEDLLDDPPLFQLCFGIPWAAPCGRGSIQGLRRFAPAGGQLDRLRDQPQPNALCRAVGSARRPCPRRPRGQPVPVPGRVRDQRPACRTGAQYRGNARCPGTGTGRSPRQVRSAATLTGGDETPGREQQAVCGHRRGGDWGGAGLPARWPGGLDVIAWDTAAGWGDRLRSAVGNAWPALRRVGLHPKACVDRLTCADSLETACRAAGFVQGERAGAAGRETEPAGADRRLDGPGRTGGLQHLRSVAERVADRLSASRADRGRSSVQPGLPAAPRGGCGRASVRHRRTSTARRACMRISACTP